MKPEIVAHVLTIQSGAQAQPRVLVVDDDFASTRVLVRCLNANGCAPTEVLSEAEAVDEMTTRLYDLVFLDWRLAQSTGDVLLKRLDRMLNRLDPAADAPLAGMQVPVIVYSARLRGEIEIPKLSHFKIIDFWTKSLEAFHLNRRISHVMHQFQYRGQLTGFLRL